jgi:hypothetical protein
MDSSLAVRLLIIPAQVTGPAGISERLDSSSVTELEVLHVGADFDDYSCAFMTWRANAKV